MANYINNEDLRPCDVCKGPLVPCFYVIDEFLAVIDSGHAQTYPGPLALYGSEAFVNVSGPGACYRIIEEPKIRRFLCQRCYLARVAADGR